MEPLKKNDLHKMVGLDIFLNSLPYEEYKKIKSCIKDIKNNQLPLTSGDFFLQHIDSIPKREEIFKLLELSKIYNWQNNIASILKGKNYEALIITDITKKILWVNDGFCTMTGYSKKNIINKTPKILQGKDTLQGSRERIQQKLLMNKPFKEVILNYKKDSTPYKCEVNIYPLYNKKQTTHFLALEKEII